MERPTTDLDWSGLAIMSPEECYDRLHHAHVARLGFVDHGEMTVSPAASAWSTSTSCSCQS